MEYHSAIKKNEILNFVGKLMELEKNILNGRGEITQAQKYKYHMFSLLGGRGK